MLAEKQTSMSLLLRFCCAVKAAWGLTRVRLGVGHALQAERCRMRKAQKHRPTGRGHRMFRGGPDDIGAIGVGKDEARVLRHEIGRHALRDREVKPVAM